MAFPETAKRACSTALIVRPLLNLEPLERRFEELEGPWYWKHSVFESCSFRHDRHQFLRNGFNLPAVNCCAFFGKTDQQCEIA